MSSPAASVAYARASVLEPSPVPSGSPGCKNPISKVLPPDHKHAPSHNFDTALVHRAHAHSHTQQDSRVFAAVASQNTHSLTSPSNSLVKLSGTAERQQRRQAGLCTADSTLLSFTRTTLQAPMAQHLWHTPRCGESVALSTQQYEERRPSDASNSAALTQPCESPAW